MDAPGPTPRGDPVIYRRFVDATEGSMGLSGRWWRVDVGIALLVCAAQLAFTTLAARGQPEREPLDLLAYALLAAGPLALVARRKYPVAVLAVAFASTLGYSLTDYPRGPIFFGLIVAFFTALTMGHRLAAIVTLVIGYVGFLWLPYLLGTEPAPSLAASLGLAAWLLVLLSAAEFVRVRRERAQEAARMREEEARRRASEERLRIARELHDALGHHIALINVQAGVALHLGEELSDQARAALDAIRQASKEALTELRSVLDILRQVDEHAPRAPTPTLRRIDDLVSGAAAAGIQVRTETVGEVRPLPFGIDVAAFRILQEALTNVARHAGSANATVHVAYGDHDLTLQVDDDGRGAASDGVTGSGKGILGMRERVAALGGELEAGPRPEGGFRVRARLPLNGSG
jgi:signal transduction histidine kinase